MGKVKRQRRKLHILSRPEINTGVKSTDVVATDSPNLALKEPEYDLFKGLDLSLENITKNKLNDDTRSVKSFKSIKSESSGNAILPKKQKLKLRRETLLKKIDAVNQMKKELKLRQKRKNNVILGDLNPLHDALPSLESLLKDQGNIKLNANQGHKKKGIKKAKHRKKELITGVKLFKQILGNKVYQKNPLGTISQHVQIMVNQELQKSKK